LCIHSFANIGACITAVLSALGKPRAAMRVAISHLLFNVLGVGVWYFFIDDLSSLVEFITGADKARQIANAHTILKPGKKPGFKRGRNLDTKWLKPKFQTSKSQTTNSKKQKSNKLQTNKIQKTNKNQNIPSASPKDLILAGMTQSGKRAGSNQPLFAFPHPVPKGCHPL
jgi:hypothetical protein